MSWSPQKESEFQELQKLCSAQDREREDFFETFISLRDATQNMAREEFLEYLAGVAPTLLDMLEPFDDRPKKIDVTGMCDEAPKYLRGQPACRANFGYGTYIRRKGKVDADAAYIDNLEDILQQMAQQVRDIAQAVKPLRDWYYAEQRSASDEVMVFAPSYGHGVSYRQLVRLLEACPRPGAIMDVQA